MTTDIYFNLFLSNSYASGNKYSFPTVSLHKLNQQKFTMASQLSQEENILYQDDTVQVFRDKIIILSYYFPIPAAKTIDMIDV